MVSRKVLVFLRQWVEQWTIYRASRLHLAWKMALWCRVCLVIKLYKVVLVFFFRGWTASGGLRPPLWGSLVTHSHTHHTREDSNRRDPYLTTHITHMRQTSVPPVGLEPAIPASHRPTRWTARPTGSEILWHSIGKFTINSRERRHLST